MTNALVPLKKSVQSACDYNWIVRKSGGFLFTSLANSGNERKIEMLRMGEHAV
jgi:hypothetical protein